jgi:hypothetical protein
MRSILLILSLGLNVWMGFALARLENYHYANLLGRCTEWNNPSSPEAAATKEACLNGQQVRTSPFWNVYWALLDQIR